MPERMYTDLAAWWPLLSPPEEYQEEAQLYRALLLAHTPQARTLLELGSGGGHNALHMKSAFSAVTLVDRSAAMLAMSKTLNPELRHVEGDMRDVRLGAVYDAVFIHDAIGHMISRDELLSALETAAIHTARGGMVLVVPDETADTFTPGTACGGTDDAEGRKGIRYLEWTYDPDPDDEMVTVDYAYLLRDGDSVETIHDRHHGGLFSERIWLDLLNAAGFDARVEVVTLSSLERGHTLFVGRKR